MASSRGRLGLGSSTVDLIGQHNLGHHGPGPELKLTSVLVVNGNAGDVAGQQIGRELDTFELAPQRGGQALGQHGLAHAWDVLNQDVALGDERRQGLLNYGSLSNNDPGYVVDYGPRRGGGGICLLHRDLFCQGEFGN